MALEPFAAAAEAATAGDGSPPQTPRDSSSIANCLRVYFALVAPEAGVHHRLLGLLQDVIVLPLVSRKSLSEFRVLAATPPSFVAAACTFLVFELVVPSPRAVTDVEVRAWRLKLGPETRLVVAAPPSSRNAETWDTERARCVLARAMALGGEGHSRPLPMHPVTPRGSNMLAPRTYITAAKTCISRGDMDKDITAAPSKTFVEQPILYAENPDTKIREMLKRGMTLMNEAIALALNRHLPASVQFRTSWRLAYSPRLHGVSLQTFYRNMSFEGPSLLLLQDHKGRAFGGFASTSWRCGDRYYGTGECFVFRLTRRLPKALRPLVDKEGRATMTRSKARRHQTQSEKDEAAAKALVNQTLEVLTQWRMDQQEAAARTERAVARCKDMITSPTEAVDDILGDCCWDETRSPPQLAKQSAPLDPQATAAENSSTASATTTAQDGGGDGGDGEDSEDEAAASSSSEAGVEVFGWSHSDPFFLFSDSDCLAMGGGSAFALYIEKDLLHGMSDQSSTFGSSVLSSTQNFIVNELEVWVFDDPAEDER
eukprot:TRINITY_DN10882_c0_g1_i1.p1 TRINITY_DN10882_c0_g1~~TRINITY_DN10882_c0_g1_i1.p1  ORF type:complete len:542 (-),score=137.38 TRINITY_DN10882_c0_g1_i1:180-1805(-)